MPLGSWAPVTTREEPVPTDLIGGSWLRVNYLTGTAPPSGQMDPMTISGTTNENFDGVVNANITARTSTSGASAGRLQPANLWTNLTVATAATINQLRQAFAVQRLYEKDARGGTRYIEMIKAHFGVTSSDARLQRAEYLGGKRIPVNMMQVLQTSSTDGTSPQGNTAAYSLTSDNSSMFTKSFEEHGIIMGVACIRTEHTYQQGIERMWSRKKRFDYYFPGLANLGEQAILNKEIYAQGTDEDDEVFGYQEAWAEYRYKPSRVSGAMRSNYANSLDVWHYADNFTSLPTLSSEFIQETDANILRTLAVQDEDQFRVDVYFSIKNTRAMPMYSIPGLIDHH